MKPIDPQEAAALMERGRDLLRNGDVASAQLVFRRLAEAGKADAALALATTYDPRFLLEHNLVGIVGDEAKARAWYRRAKEAGSIELTIFCNQQIQNKQALRYRCPSGRTFDVQNSGLLRLLCLLRLTRRGRYARSPRVLIASLIVSVMGTAMLDRCHPKACPKSGRHAAANEKPQPFRDRLGLRNFRAPSPIAP